MLDMNVAIAFVAACASLLAAHECLQSNASIRTYAHAQA